MESTCQKCQTTTTIITSGGSSCGIVEPNMVSRYVNIVLALINSYSPTAEPCPCRPGNPTSMGGTTDCIRRLKSLLMGRGRGRGRKKKWWQRCTISRCFKAFGVCSVYNLLVSLIIKYKKHRRSMNCWIPPSRKK